MSADMLTREQVEEMRAEIKQPWPGCMSTPERDAAMDALCDMALHGLDGARDAGLEEAAKLAEAEWLTYMDTKLAHERLAATPFAPAAFGLSTEKARRSQELAQRIRALKKP